MLESVVTYIEMCDVGAVDMVKVNTRSTMAGVSAGRTDMMDVAAMR